MIVVVQYFFECDRRAPSIEHDVMAGPHENVYLVIQSPELEAM
jgi:hypothetical protein